MGIFLRRLPGAILYLGGGRQIVLHEFDHPRTEASIPVLRRGGRWFGGLAPGMHQSQNAGDLHV